MCLTAKLFGKSQLMNRKLRRLQKKEAKKRGYSHQNPAEVSGLQVANELYRLGKITEAIQTLEKVLEINPRSIDGVSLLAIIKANSGDVDSALKLFKEATLISPKNAMTHFNFGRALDDAGRPDEAKESYHLSLRIDPNRVDVHINLGSLLIDTGDFDGAANHLEKAIKIEPDNALAHSNLGLVLKHLKQFDRAASSCIKAIAINKKYPSAHYNLACIYFEMARIKDALCSFQDTLNLNPEYLEAWNGLEIAAKIDGSFFWKKYLGDAAQSTVYFELVEYSIKKLRPHEAKEQFQKTMLALPETNREEIRVIRQVTVSESTCTLPKNMVALLHFGRSGTGLFHSLIDDHPEISTLPSIYFRGFFNPGVWSSISEGGYDGLPERFANKFAVLFDASSPISTPGKLHEVSSSLGIKEGMANVGVSRDEVLSVDREKFCSAAYSLMQNYEKINAGTFFLIIHAAYEMATGNKRKKNTAFYHIHNPDDFALLNFLRYNPMARLVTMVREPIECCESWLRKNFEQNNYKDMVHQIISMLFGLDQVVFQTQDSVGIRLEDLKKNPKGTLQAFCHWLGIEETPSLYEMTAQGKKWWGDPSSPDFNHNEAMSPFGKFPKNRTVGNIFNEDDLLVFETLFYPISVHFEYLERDTGRLRRNLEKVFPLLDQMLGFEKIIAERSNVNYETFVSSSSYKLLRRALNYRLKVLKEFNDYPNIISKLKI